MRLIILTLLTFTLAGCGGFGWIPRSAEAPSGIGSVRPVARPEGLQAVPPPPVGARTAEQFDTTSAEDRAEAAKVASGAEVRVGITIASLGDPSRPGFWLETPLVTTLAQGRVRYPKTGKSAQVQLIPIDGPKTAGSRLSLPAMRLIGAPLTELPEVEVFSGG